MCVCVEALFYDLLYFQTIYDVVMVLAAMYFLLVFFESVPL